MPRSGRPFDRRRLAYLRLVLTVPGPARHPAVADRDQPGPGPLGPLRALAEGEVLAMAPRSQYDRAVTVSRRYATLTCLKLQEVSFRNLDD